MILLDEEEEEEEGNDENPFCPILLLSNQTKNKKIKNKRFEQKWKVINNYKVEEGRAGSLEVTFFFSSPLFESF
jgi:hypothetical protein